ncbi:MAG: LON peptidase substrate-binding domain-containing protein [Acidimicrobiales bacterium]
MVVLPQFPLRLVLFPTMVLPLHVFEPRYRALVHDVLESDRRFGVVMIEKGLDTGGDDQRSSFGTVAQVVEAEELPDGRWALVTIGVERFKVKTWLPDDPYPVADVELWPDEPPGPPPEADFDRVAGKFRRCMALASEAGVDTGPMPDSLEGGELGTMQMAAMLPVGTFDKQNLLGAPDAPARLASLETAIEQTLELVELQLRGG